MAALSFYQCDYGMVITNSSYTQQAENLASTNGVLMIDGDELLSMVSSDIALRETLDRFVEQAQNGEPISRSSSEWLINDLVVRYGVSSAKIYKDFLGSGLPFYKVGREYHFVPGEVEEWEIHKKYVPYGRGGNMPLPAFLNYKTEVQDRIKESKKNGDRRAVAAIKEEMRYYGIKPSDLSNSSIGSLILMALAIIICVILIVMYCPIIIY